MTRPGVRSRSGVMVPLSSDSFMTNALSLAGLGIVAIGRNEGPRLERCLRSLPVGVPRVYVDSGSTDGSVAFARSLGVHVVELDMAIPFTAARARNAGFERLLATSPDLRFALFVDGDCEIVADWLGAAIDVLHTRADVGAVCGFRRERHPEQSVWNTVCDVEWRHSGPGEVREFGGDALIRASVLRSVGGYDPNVIAGEDPELSLRVRRAGWKIVRLPATSTWHDAAMTSPRQWWTRAKRCGHAFAQVNWMHGGLPDGAYASELRRAWLWGLALPGASIALAPITLGTSMLALTAAFPLQAARIAAQTRRRGFSARESALWGASCALSKFPESLGILKFHFDRWRGRSPTLIEYKGPERGSAEWRARTSKRSNGSRRTTS